MYVERIYFSFQVVLYVNELYTAYVLWVRVFGDKIYVPVLYSFLDIRESELGVPTKVYPIMIINWVLNYICLILQKLKFTEAVGQ